MKLIDNFHNSLITIVVVIHKVIPKKLKASVGETVKFVCDSESEVTWFFENGPLQANVETEPPLYRKLIIRDVAVINAGSYTCFGRDAESDFLKFEAEGSLQLVSKFIVI